jgi:hypothetical protein
LPGERRSVVELDVSERSDVPPTEGARAFTERRPPVWAGK